MNANKRGELATKLVLALLFVLGLGLVFNGLQAQKIYNQSGFSAEGAFQAIYRLSEEVESDWNTLLRPALEALPEEKQTALNELAETLLHDFWQERAGDGADPADFLPERGNTEALQKLLYISYTVGGPKVSSSVKKAVNSAGAEVSAALLEAAADEGTPVPACAEDALKKLTGSARQGMLMQLYYQTLTHASALKTEDVNSFKKGVARWCSWASCSRSTRWVWPS